MLSRKQITERVRKNRAEAAEAQLQPIPVIDFRLVEFAMRRANRGGFWQEKQQRLGMAMSRASQASAQLRQVLGGG